jgi:exopolysaccharide biosynthesis polyprenyl glycosylphosphotransferase
MSDVQSSVAEFQEARPRPALTVAPEWPETSKERHGLANGRVRVLAAADVITLGLALAGTMVIAEASAPPAVIAPSAVAIVLGIVALLSWIPIFAAHGLYEKQTRAIAPRSFDEISTVFHALIAGSLLFLVVSQVLRRAEGWVVFSAAEAATFCVLAIVMVPTARAVVRTWLFPAIMRGRRTLIVGSGPAGRLVRSKIEASPQFGLEFIGFVDDAGTSDLLGKTADLARIVDEHEIDWILMADSGTPYEETLELVRRVRRPDVHLSIVPQFFEVFTSNATIEDLQGVPIVSLPTMHFSRPVRALKRTFDILISSAVLLAVTPILAVAAVMIRLDSKGPILFRQVRNGRGGKPFKILKLRTMVVDAESQRFDLVHLNQVDGPLFKIKSDPRITGVGGFLRRWSIDELPQLWNVLRGEMSLVGPRPFVVHEAEKITGWAGRRLETTPGITGLWQVLGRNDLPFDEMVKLDYIYVTNWSLWWDIKILVQTVPVVLARRGAY